MQYSFLTVRKAQLKRTFSVDILKAKRLFYGWQMKAQCLITRDFMAKMNVLLCSSPLSQGTTSFPEGEWIKFVDKPVLRRVNGLRSLKGGEFKASLTAGWSRESHPPSPSSICLLYATCTSLHFSRELGQFVRWKHAGLEIFWLSPFKFPKVA